MEFFVQCASRPHRVGILAGSFNPPTVAHVELIRAAGPHLDEVVCVLPRAFPHKEYFGANIEQRLNMMVEAFPCSVAISEGGLFIDIAKECREHFGRDATLYFLCGADAAERIVNWDYGAPDTIDRMLDEFQLLVAPRQQIYEPPRHLRRRIHSLSFSGEHQSVSSTEVRERIQRSEPWQHLVPESIRDKVRSIYS